MLPHDEDALRTDAYIDRLIAAGAASPRPAAFEAEPDQALAEAVEVVRRTLVRFHPSFRFADRLAARLASASGEDDVSAAVPTGELVALPDRSAARSPGSEARGRLLLSGAIASGFSIAGAALFAWRRSRPPVGAFGRAARAVQGAHAPGARHARQRIRRERLS
jgi:hypothetical protein